MFESNTAQRLALLIGMLLALASLARVYLYAGSFPIHDDYKDSLRFILDYMDAPWGLALIDVIREQHMEHRPTVSHILSALYFEARGDLDYRNLLLLANGMVVAVFLLLSCHFRNAWLTLIAALILLTPAYWNSMFWFAAAGSNFSVVLFALATLVLLGRKSQTSFNLALCSSLICVFSLGNGFLLLPVGLLQLYWQRAGRGQISLWCVWSLLCIALYFFDYQEPQIIQDMFYADGTENAWQLMLHKPLRFISWTLSVLGCGLGFGNDVLAMLAGGILCALFIYALASGATRSHPVASAMSIFLMLSLALVAHQRFFIAFTQVDLPNRYAFYSLVLTVVLMGLGAAILSERVQQRSRLSLMSLLLAAAFAFHLYSIPWGLERGQKMIAPVQKNLLQWLQGESSGIFALFAGVPEPIIARAIDRGVYDPLKLVPNTQRGELLDAGVGCAEADKVITFPEDAFLLRLDTLPPNSRVCLRGYSYRPAFNTLPAYFSVPSEQGLL